MKTLYVSGTDSSETGQKEEPAKVPVLTAVLVYDVAGVQGSVGLAEPNTEGGESCLMVRVGTETDCLHYPAVCCPHCEEYSPVQRRYQSSLNKTNKTKALVKNNVTEDKQYVPLQEPLKYFPVL